MGGRLDTIYVVLLSIYRGSHIGPNTGHVPPFLIFTMTSQFQHVLPVIPQMRKLRHSARKKLAWNPLRSSQCIAVGGRNPTPASPFLEVQILFLVNLNGSEVIIEWSSSPPEAGLGTDGSLLTPGNQHLKGVLTKRSCIWQAPL